MYNMVSCRKGRTEGGYKNMRKLIALALVLMMALTVVSAVAEEAAVMDYAA